MDTQNFEQMAREYKNALAAMPINTDSATYLERIIILGENQLSAYNDFMLTLRYPLSQKMLNYLKTLTYQSLVVATKLLNGSLYIPPYRNIGRGNPSTALCRMINDQIDIFILLDKLSSARTDLNELIDLENRKMAIMAAF